MLRAAWLLIALVPPACSLPRSPTMAAVPPEWRHGNPFGPEANAARAAGLLPVYGEVPRAAEWEEFARSRLETGDILFRRGKSNNLKGKLTTEVLAGANDGRFSHVGLARWEGDQLWVYDVESEGVRKVPFVLWMLDVDGDDFAVKRVRSEYRHCIPQAMAFCEDAYQRHVGFNFSLGTDGKRLYCSEMVERSYRSAGLSLAEPLPIHQMPGFRRYRILVVPLVEFFMGVDRNRPVYAIGNEHYGTWASPYLDLVYEGPEPDQPVRGKPVLEGEEPE
jgi:hypothetical protein